MGTLLWRFESTTLGSFARCTISRAYGGYDLVVTYSHTAPLREHLASDTAAVTRALAIADDLRLQGWVQIE